MTVVLLGPVPPPYGGVQVHLMALRKYLLRHDHRCFAVNLTHYRRSNGNGLFFPHSALEVLILLYRLKPDIAHVHMGGTPSLRLIALGLVCVLMGHRVVMTLHSGGYPSSDEGRRLNAWALRSWLLRRFHRLIAVNSEIALLFERCGVPRRRLRLISPFSSPALLNIERDEELEPFLSHCDPLLLTVGLLEPEYELLMQIEVLGELLATFPGAGLIIVGSGSLHKELADTIASKSWFEKVYLTGDLDHSRTLYLISRADVFLRTTRFDGDALSVQEALELGIPVIATKTAFRPPGVYLVDVGDHDGLRDAIVKMIYNQASSTHATKIGTQNIEKVVDLYTELLGDD